MYEQITVQAYKNKSVITLLKKIMDKFLIFLGFPVFPNFAKGIMHAQAKPKAPDKNLGKSVYGEKFYNYIR